MKVRITQAQKTAQKNLNLPAYSTAGSAGMDVYAACAETICIKPGSVELVPTGFAIELPQGYECQVRSRSGLAINHGIFCLNSPGTIDSDFRGEVKVILANFGKNDFLINNGDRIAQLIVAQYEKVEWELVESLDETNRGSGGFGSTGI